MSTTETASPSTDFLNTMQDNDGHKMTIHYLAEYAAFLQKHKLDELAVELLRLSREFNVPIIKYLNSISDEELIKRAKAGLERLLQALSQNKVDDYIKTSINLWVNNQIQFISRDQISPEDIALLSLIRRKLFRDFLHTFSRDLNLYIKIMEETDRFTTYSDAASFKTILSIQHDLYKQAQAIAHVGNWVYDLKTGKITWTEELFRIYEMEPEPELTFDIRSFNHPEDADRVNEEMRISRETLQPHNFYYRIVLKDGRVKVLHARGQVLTDEKGNANKMFGTLQDVTKEKQAELELNNNQHLIHKMTDEVEDYAILLLNPDGIIQNWNKGAEKIKGYKADEIIGKSFRIFYTPEDQENKLPETLISHAFRMGKAMHEGWRVRKDGTKFWGSIVITCLHDDIGNVIGFSKVTRDLTARKKAEENLRQYAHSLEQKNKELDEKNKELESFSYVASHDLQEPLRKILVFSNRIANQEDFSEKSKDYQARIINACNRMQMLIDALLSYSHANTSTIKFEKTDLNILLDDVKRDLSELIEENEVLIEATTLPTMNVIPLQFQQLFHNILSNAIKYRKNEITPHIKISASVVPNDMILLSPKKEAYKISIADNGIGFEQEYANKIFELFQRLHGKAEYAGTGVGLAICKRIVQNHNGIITAESEPGNGATFNIYIPKD